MFAKGALVVVWLEGFFAAGGFVFLGVEGVLGAFLGDPVQDVGVGEADGAGVEDGGHLCSGVGGVGVGEGYRMDLV